MSRRAVIIDDDEDLSEVLGETLSDLGFEVDSAPDTESGYRLLKEDRYDLVLLDLKLPGDGFSLLNRIDFSGGDTRLFVITGSPLHGLPEEREKLLEKAEEIFTKPFPMVKFIKKINQR
jgi:DNA-binding response OmpR family regulator